MKIAKITSLLLLLLLFASSSQDAKAKFFGWEQSSGFTSAYTDGTVCVTMTFYVFGIAVDSYDKCGQCCDGFEF